MFIKTCRLEAFGQFREKEFDEVDRPLVIVLGPNEAGKSTFFHFLQSILFGIYPTRIEAHPYAPRDGSPISGSAVLRMKDDREVTISRRLTRTPQGQLSGSDDEEIDLRNKVVPAIEFVSSRVFDAVYALDLHDMTALRGKAWADVQDRLLGGFNLDFLRSVRQVVGELEEEANRLWRPDRRGRPLARRLRDERAQLREQLAKAGTREQELADLQSEIDQHESRLKRLRDELPVLQSEARRLDRIGPIALRWRKIKSLDEQAGDIERLAHVPDNAGAILEEWSRRDAAYTQRLAEIEEEEEVCRFEIDAVEEGDAKIADRRPEILAWSKRVGAHETHQASLREVGLELCELTPVIRDAANRLAEPGRQTSLTRGIDAVDFDELQSLVGVLGHTTTRLIAARKRHRLLTEREEKHNVYLPLAVIGVGLTAVGVGVYQSIQWLWLTGGLVGGVGVAWLIMAIFGLRSIRFERKRLGVDDLEDKHADQADAVRDLFGDIGIRETFLANPDSALVSSLNDLRQLLKRRGELSDRARSIVKTLDSDMREISRLARDLDVDMRHTVSDTAEEIDKRYAEVKDRLETAERARRRLRKLQDDRQRITEQQHELRDQIARLRSSLTEIGEGRVREGMRTIEQRRRASEMAEHHTRTLDKDHPGWRDELDALEKLTAEDFQAFTDQARLERDHEIDELREEIDLESSRFSRKKARLQHLQQHQTPAEIESKLEFIGSRIVAARRRRDRLLLLSSIIRRADEQFRFRHQPDVIKKASGYLHSITEGRYQRMLIQEDASQLVVFERGSNFPIEVDEALSQGTRDQIYLSIRFALMDHLDVNQERLPAFLDEVFVNWDEDRRKLGYEIVRDLSSRRQVFVFTCHDWLADELRSVTEAHLIKLDAD